MQARTADAPLVFVGTLSLAADTAPAHSTTPTDRGQSLTQSVGIGADGQSASPRSRRPGIWKAALLAIVTAGVLAMCGSPALARTVSCGETITTDTTLHNDLTDCAGNGLVVGGDNITQPQWPHRRRQQRR